MRYYATASGSLASDAMAGGYLGQIVTPAAGNRVQSDVDWIADNAVFADRYPGDDAYLAWLANRAQFADRCRFVVAPDVVGDARGTLRRASPMLARIRELGFPVAFVAQNGIYDTVIPWNDFDALFIGGTTDWKLGAEVRGLIREAREQGKWVHMGRVNSRRRIQYAEVIGCDSVDGTYLAFGPDLNLPKLLDWVAEIERQGAFW